MQQELVWTDVDSSHIQRVAHDPDTLTLAVQFHGGGLYSYAGVDEEVYVSLVHAESVGKYLNAAIKGYYPYRKHHSEQELLDTIAV